MVNSLTSTRSESITTLSPRKVSEEDKALVQAMVRIRQIQGWNLQKPEDAKLMGTIWKEDMNRHKIRPELYQTLINMAVDHRVKEISQGKSPTPLTVELLISCYYQYRSLKLEELSQINNRLEYYRSLRHRYQTQQIELQAAAKQGKFHGEISEEEFLRVSQEVIDDLEQKKESFKEDNWL